MPGVKYISLLVRDVIKIQAPLNIHFEFTLKASAADQAFPTWNLSLPKQR